MVAIRLSAIVNDNHELTIKLPEEIPPGEVEIIIHTKQPPVTDTTQLTREEARAKLAAAGKLSRAHRLPENAAIPVDDTPIKLPPGSRRLEELIDEDRNEG